MNLNEQKHSFLLNFKSLRSFWVYSEQNWTILGKVTKIGLWHMTKGHFWDISVKNVQIR
jgi:hypothetical protein